MRWRSTIVLGPLTLLLVLLSTAAHATPGIWTLTGSMNVGRYIHTATLLPNGKVLVAGGYSAATALSSAELYDPITGVWTPTGSLTSVRYDHTATMLPNGKVLVASGCCALNTAELYDTDTGVWSATGSLTSARYLHTAALLQNGKVLVAGGIGAGNVFLSSAELYDPSTGVWAATGSLSYARRIHTATVLPNGKVLVAGGYDGASKYYRSAVLYEANIPSAPTIVSANSATFTVGSVGSFTVTATGNPAPALSLSGTLPEGVSFNAASGVLSGTPTASGSFPLTFTASNGVLPDATQSFTLTVNPADDGSDTGDHQCEQHDLHVVYGGQLHSDCDQ